MRGGECEAPVEGYNCACGLRPDQSFYILGYADLMITFIKQQKKCRVDVISIWHIEKTMYPSVAFGKQHSQIEKVVLQNYYIDQL